MQGQINRGSKLGEYIFNLSKNPEVNTIVDIGTWNGLGSTKCVLDGIMDSNPSKKVISIECNKLRYEEAKVNLGFLPINFKIIHGTVVEDKDLYPIYHNIKNETSRKWLEEDINWIKNTPNVLNSLPEKIDLLIIDGGEFSGEIEFNILKDRSKYIILDDTDRNKCNKNWANRDFILNHPNEFEIIEDNLNDRNGFLVCKNLKNV